jgi:hypothetical protein
LIEISHSRDTIFIAGESHENPSLHKKVRRPPHFLGGSDARVIMGSDEAALISLWKEKRGESE